MKTQTPHRVIAVPLSLKQAERFDTWLAAYHEHGGEETEHQIRQQLFVYGLQIVEESLFRALQELEQESTEQG